MKLFFLLILCVFIVSTSAYYLVEEDEMNLIDEEIALLRYKRGLFKDLVKPFKGPFKKAKNTIKSGRWTED